MTIKKVTSNNKMMYDNDQCNNFVKDMKRAKFEIFHIKTGLWEGPVVLVGNYNFIGTVQEKTKIRTSFDTISESVYAVRPKLIGILVN